jgi:hypothetical protein
MPSKNTKAAAKTAAANVGAAHEYALVGWNGDRSLKVVESISFSNILSRDAVWDDCEKFRERMAQSTKARKFQVANRTTGFYSKPTTFNFEDAVAFSKALYPMIVDSCFDAGDELDMTVHTCPVSLAIVNAKAGYKPTDADAYKKFDRADWQTINKTRKSIVTKVSTIAQHTDAFKGSPLKSVADSVDKVLKGLDLPKKAKQISK